MRTITLRTQSELKDLIESTIKDQANERWSTREIYQAINQGLYAWHGHVRIPMLYSFTSGFSAGVYEYTIPSYVGHNFRPQIRGSTSSYWGTPSGDDTYSTWLDVAGWTVDPQADGTRKLRFQVPPYAEDGRLIWFAANGPVPAVDTLPVTNGALTSSSTSLTVTSSPFVGEAGFVLVDSEWIGYAGTTRTSSTLTLTNLSRGLYGTSAASHDSGATVQWGVAADHEGLWSQLMWAAVAHLHFLVLHRGTQEDRLNHEKIMGYAQDQANDFWRRSGYVASGSPRITFGQSWVM